MNAQLSVAGIAGAMVMDEKSGLVLPTRQLVTAQTIEQIAQERTTQRDRPYQGMERTARSGGRYHVGRAKIVPGPKRMLPWQAKYIMDNSRLKLLVKSRQIGGSKSAQVSLVDRKSLTSATTDAFVSSSNEGQARLFVEGCYAYAKEIHVEAVNEGLQVIDEEGNSAYVLRFANGRRIFSMSSSVNAQAGKTGDRVLDEFATIPHARELYGVAFPGTMWGGSRLEIISTQRGRDTYLNELIEEIVHGGNPKRFSFHKVTLQDALDQGLLYKLQQHAPEDDVIQEMDEADYFNYIRASCPDEEFFLQEYMCVASDLRTAFLSHDLIASCEYGPDEKWELTDEMIRTSQNQWFLGVDIARDKDLSAFWLLEKMGDVLYTRGVEVMEKGKLRCPGSVARQLDAVSPTHALLHRSDRHRASIR